MTTLGPRVPRVSSGLLVGGVLLLGWAGTLSAWRLGFARPPVNRDMITTLTYAVPLSLAAIALFRRIPSLAILAGVALAVMLALVLPPEIARDPKLAWAFPAAAVGGVVTKRYPLASLSAVFALAGTYGTITAYTGVPADSVMDKVVDGLWIGVLGHLLIGHRAAGIRRTPTYWLLGAFLVVCALFALSTTPLAVGIRAFRLVPLFLSAVLLVGYGGFSRRTLDLLARVMVVVCLIVAAYAALRWAIGASAKEAHLQKTSLDRQFNKIGITNDTKVQGSLPNGYLLGLWMACTIPLLIAAAVSWRGPFRVVAAAAVPLSAIGLLGSAQRVGLAAAVAGGLTIIVIHVLSRGSRGHRLGVAAAAVAGLFVAATVVYPLVLDNPEKQKRYESLLNPGQDGPFRERVEKWRATLDDIQEKPWGHGLGSGNPQAVNHRFFDVAILEIDNSYLMIAWEQGLVVMAFFIAVMLVLLFELLRFSVWTRGPGESALSGAAAGTLVAMLVEFTANDLIYSPPIVAGWMIVGLGVAQFATPRRGEALRAQPA